MLRFLHVLKITIIHFTFHLANMKTFYSKHFLLTLFAIIALFFISNAQNTEGPPFCAGEAMMQQFLKNTEHQNQHQRVEQQILRYMSSPAALRSRSTSAIITLPVVVHIIHNGGAENISDAQVIKGIQDLNDAFANKGYYDPTTGVNTDIQFCLAQRDPNNLATNGITRDVSPLTNMTMETDDIILKNINRWQPTCYINIWLIKEISSNSSGSGVAGYAYLPSAHASIFDGIVEEARWFGSSPANSGVTIHEMGHYLGLYHTFNGDCTNNNCLTDGDHVCDTPPDQSRGAGCNPSANSCTTDSNDPSLNNPFRAIGLGGKGDVADMSDNYMDYSPFSCYSSFTQGQKDRMNFFIQNTRKSLLACKSCETPCPTPVTVKFTPSATTVQVGTTVSFTNTTTGATIYRWFENNIQFSTTPNTSRIFSNPGKYWIRLEAESTSTLCSGGQDSVLITVECKLIKSDFTGTNIGQAGTTLSFTNTGTGGSTYEWTVDNAVVGATPNLSYKFSNSGAYNVCLKAQNGVCSDSKCFTVYIGVDSQKTDCGATFLKILRGAGTNIIDVTFQPRIFPLKNEAGAYICGTIGDSAVLVKMRSDGTTEWERSFNFTAYPDIITELITDSEGNIVGSGYGLIGTSAPFYKAFIFKYNPTSNSFIWLKTPEQDGFNFHSIHEITGNQYYVFTSSTYIYGVERLHMMRVDRNTGNISTINQSYHQGNFISVYYKDALYSSSRYYYPSYRSSISKHDVNGNHLWTKACVVPSSSNARTYSNKLIIDQDSIIVAHSGNFTDFAGVDDGPTDYIVTKSDINGKTAWTKKYTLAGAGLDRPYISTILNASDGYYFIANLYDPAIGSWGKFFIIKTDKNGTVKWSKLYGIAGKNAAFSAFERNGYLYFAGTTQSYSNQEDLFILKVDVNGKIGSDCSFIRDVQVAVETLPNYDEDQTQEAQNEQFTLSNITSRGNATSIGKDTKCSKECTVTTPTDCNNPLFSKKYTFEEDGTSFWLHALKKDNNNTAIAVGFSTAPNTIVAAPFLAKLNDKGLIIWTKQVPLDGGAWFFDVQTTLDGGYIAVGDNNRKPFIVKFSSTGIVEWINTNESSQGVGIGEFKSVVSTKDGGFVAVGQINNNGNAYIAKFRNDGSLIWSRELGANATDWSYSLQESNDNNLMVAVNTTTGKGNYLVKINNTDGSTIWQKEYSSGATIDCCDHSFNYISKTTDGSYLVTGAWSSEIALLKKIDKDGNILWSKGFSQSGKRLKGTFVFESSSGDYFLGLANNDNTSERIIVKLDASFNIVWQKTIPHLKEEYIKSIMEFNNNSFWIAYNESGVKNGFTITEIDALGKSCKPLNNSDVVIQTLTSQITNGRLSNIVGGRFIKTTPEIVSRNVLMTNSCLECKDICNNGIDDDGDGLIDNADVLDCPCNKCFDNDSVKIVGTNTICDFNSAYTYKLKNFKCDKFKTNWLIKGVGLTDIFSDDTTCSMKFTQSTTFDLTAIIKDSCGIDTIYFKIQAIAPPPVLELGPDKTICQTGVFTFKAPRGFKSYLWQDFTTDSVFTAFGAGKYWVRVMDSCGGVQSDTVRITQLIVPNLNIVPDTLKICQGDSLVVTAPTGWATYRWSPSVGVNDTFKRVITLTPSVSGRYFCAVSTTAGCVSSDSLWVEVKPLNNAVRAASICAGLSYKIGDSTFTKAGVYSVRLKSTTGGCDTLVNLTLNTINNFTKQIDSLICTSQMIKIGDSTFTKAGNYTVILRGRLGTCDTIVTVNLKSPNIVEQTLTKTICQGQNLRVGDSIFVKNGTYKVFINNTLCKDTVITVNLKVTDIAVQTAAFNTCPNAQNGRITSSIQNGTPPYTYAWSNGVTTANLSNLSAGIYTITVSDVNNCKDTATVNIKATPQYSYNLSVKQPTCFGDANGEIRITSTEKLSVSFDSVVFNRSGFLNNLRAGNYPIFVKDSNNCIYSEFINIPQPPQLTLSLPADTLLKLGDSVRIESITNGVGRLKYRWQPVRDLNCDTCASVVAKPTTGIFYTLTLTDSTGCQVRDDIRLQVNRVCNIFIPNVFSPFSTVGENDVFYPYASDCAKQVAFMEVFDRWGEMVFHKINFPLNDPSSAWDGTLNGKQLEAAVYTYRIEIILADGRLERFFGDVTLMR